MTYHTHIKKNGQNPTDKINDLDNIDWINACLMTKITLSKSTI